MDTANRTNRHANYPQPTLEDLRDNQRLRAWLEARLAFAGLPASHHVMIQGFAAAERALEHGATPERLFAWLISRGLRGGWDYLSDDQLFRGKMRLAELERDEQPPIPDYLQALVQKMSIT